MDRLNAMTIALDESAELSADAAKAVVTVVFTTPGVEVDPETNAAYVTVAQEDTVLHAIQGGGFKIIHNFPLRYVEVPYDAALNGIVYEGGTEMAILLTQDNYKQYSVWRAEPDQDKLPSYEGMI